MIQKPAAAALLAVTILFSQYLPAGEGVTGRWEGTIEMNGQQIPLAVGIRSVDGGLGGRADVQGLKGLVLENLSYRAPRVSFEMQSPVGKAVFTGKVSDDSISGEYSQPGSEGAFSLTRKAAVDIDGVISAYMEEQHIPGVAAAIVRDGETVWVGAYGYANVAESKPVTRDTVFMLASVTKTLTATALLQLQAKGKFRLDDDVNDYLPFRVRNPNHPDTPITFGQLLQHRSSIRDNAEYYRPFWSQATGDPETVLGDYLREYLAEGGANYNAEENFYGHPPGNAALDYCNTCYALIGYLAERISGKPYEEYATEALLEPLGMRSAGWFYRDVDADRVAMPYRHDPEEGYVGYGVNGYPDWPAGQLRMNVLDLARFLGVFTRGGMLEGAAVIDPAVIELMAPKYPALGYYTWFISSLESTGDVLYSHGGGDIGTRTLIGFDPATGDGFVILTNGEAATRPLAAKLYSALPTLGWK